MATPEEKKAPRDLDEDKVVAEFNHRKERAREHSKEWRKEARQLYDLKAGHQWSDDDKRAIEEKYNGTYPMVTFNVSEKYCDAVGGLQINNRQEIKYSPRRVGPVSMDEYATGVVQWNRDQCEAEDEETDCFNDLFWVGMAWVEHFAEDTEDERYIAQERRDPLEMLWDWTARKRNLSDRRFQIRIKPFTAEEYEEFFDEELDAVDGIGDALTIDQGSPAVIPPNQDYGDGEPGSGQERAPIHVADYQWWRNETRFRVTAKFPENPETGVPAETLVQEFSKADWRAIEPGLRTDATYEVEKVVRRKYYRAWIAGEKILQQAGKPKIRELPCGFTYEAITGRRDRNRNTWYGMGRTVSDPQLWINKFFSSILYTLTVNAKGGLMAEEDAFADQRKAERSWADPAAITFVENGAISGGKIMPKPQAPYPQGMDRLMTFALEAMPLTSGMNPELLGLAQREQAGVLEAQRKQSAMAIIAWVFDAMRRYYKRSGKLMLAMVRTYLDEGQIMRIIGPEGAQYMPFIKDKLAARYDIDVDESPTSSNMIERVWFVLERIIPQAIQMGLPVPPEVIQYSPLPTSLKDKWLKYLQAQQKPSPEALKQKALAERAANAQVAKDESTATLNQAKAVETVAKAQVVPIEAALTQVQTIKEAAAAGAAQAGGVG